MPHTQPARASRKLQSPPRVASPHPHHRRSSNSASRSNESATFLRPATPFLPPPPPPPPPTLIDATLAQAHPLSKPTSTSTSSLISPIISPPFRKPTPSQRQQRPSLIQVRARASRPAPLHVHYRRSLRRRQSTRNLTSPLTRFSQMLLTIPEEKVVHPISSPSPSSFIANNASFNVNGNGNEKNIKASALRLPKPGNAPLSRPSPALRRTTTTPTPNPPKPRMSKAARAMRRRLQKGVKTARQRALMLVTRRRRVREASEQKAHLARVRVLVGRVGTEVVRRGGVSFGEAWREGDRGGAAGRGRSEGDEGAWVDVELGEVRQKGLAGRDGGRERKRGEGGGWEEMRGRGVELIRGWAGVAKRRWEVLRRYLSQEVWFPTWYCVMILLGAVILFVVAFGVTVATAVAMAAR